MDQLGIDSTIYRLKLFLWRAAHSITRAGTAGAVAGPLRTALASLTLGATEAADIIELGFWNQRVLLGRVGPLGGGLLRGLVATLMWQCLRPRPNTQLMRAFGVIGDALWAGRPRLVPTDVQLIFGVLTIARSILWIR